MAATSIGVHVSTQGLGDVRLAGRKQGPRRLLKRASKTWKQKAPPTNRIRGREAASALPPYTTQMYR